MRFHKSFPVKEQKLSDTVFLQELSEFRRYSIAPVGVGVISVSFLSDQFLRAVVTVGSTLGASHVTSTIDTDQSDAVASLFGAARAIQRAEIGWLTVGIRHRIQRVTVQIVKAFHEKFVVFGSV